jgi:hypothetical protein
MPMIPAAMSGLMMAKAVSKTLSGSKLSPQISAVSSAVCLYFTAAPIVVTTNIVTGPGAGTYTGRIVGVIPSAMSGMMMLKAASLGLVGRDVKKLFDAISFGVCQTLLTTVIIQGTVIGGGPGAGQGKIIGLVPSALQTLIVAQMAVRGLIGSKTAQIASAMAFGICMHVMSTGMVMTTCIGAFTPPPVGPVPIPAAPGPGRLI